jgi:peptidyl-prolyl cis-trans isomerase A (cyclophilin A)
MHRVWGVFICLTGLVFIPACLPVPMPSDYVPAANQAPVISTGGDLLVTENTTVDLDASGTTDPDGDAMSFLWTQLTGPSVTLVNADTDIASFQAPAVLADTPLSFQVVVTDAQGNRSTGHVTVTVRMAIIPHAEAGNDKTTAPSIDVALAGSSWGSPTSVSYGWVQTAGPEVALTGADTATPNFVAPSVDQKTVLTFQITATDLNGGSSSDSVNVTVASKVRFKTAMGDFVMHLRGDAAPVTVTNLLSYVTSGFYVGLTIHRVIPAETVPGGIIQGGGWDPNLNSPPRLDPIILESNNGLHNVRGAVAMARLSEPDTATSEFFINTDDNLDLDYNASTGALGYAVFAEIVEGMDIVDAMSHVATTQRTAPWNSNVIFYDYPVVPIIFNEVILE